MALYCKRKVSRTEGHATPMSVSGRPRLMNPMRDHGLFSCGSPPSYLTKSALSFSKKLDNHVGVIRYFICHYNLTRATV
jgi:hypothetical protein